MAAQIKTVHTGGSIRLDNAHGFGTFGRYRHKNTGAEIEVSDFKVASGTSIETPTSASDPLKRATRVAIEGGAVRTISAAELRAWDLVEEA